jgi:hypothetical protein
MRVLEEPFTTREVILAILRPGQPATESPFRTLRQHHCASEGLRVDVRTTVGQMLGRAHFYSLLNIDAARAVRLGEPKLAQRLAARAGELELSHHADIIRDAIQVIGSKMSADPPRDDTPVAFRRYLRSRGQSSWRGLDQHALTREWLVHSAAWLDQDEHGEIVEAVTALAQAASEARADLLDEATLPPASTFFGVVRRLDPSAAEVQGDHETRLVPHDDLERQGLAVVGQAVSLLCEVLPTGGSLVFPMPAVAVETLPSTAENSPWDLEGIDEGIIIGSILDPVDEAWLKRELAREPTAMPLAPLRRG